MKILSAVAILAFLPQSFGLQGDFDDRYGHVKPFCEDDSITNMVTLDELVSQQQENKNSNDPVTVPCGFRATAAHGNTYNLASGLEVLGELTFKDKSNSDKETIIEAPYILVRGHLQAGTIDQPFESKLRFVLTEFKNFPNTHHNLTVDHDSSNTFFNHPHNFGDKAFVVFGGTVSLYGPPEGEKITAKLGKSVKRGGTNKFHVEGDWSKYWKSGDHIVMTGTTDYTEGGGIGPGAKEFTLLSSKYNNKKKRTRLALVEKFTIAENRRSDYARKKVITRNYKGKKKIVWMTAEVFKLTRNIVVQGIPIGSDMTAFIGTDYTDDVKQSPRGGHFVVAHTAKRQIIHGVEFSAMGQPGIIGRYPIHFHSCGNIDSGTIVKHNSVHHSKQRCVVVHATNGLTIQQNSAYWADNNCFMTEDGYEHSNTFRGNVAVSVQKAAYWMANPDNDLVDNIAANSNMGFEITEKNADGEGTITFSDKHNIPCQKIGGELDENGCSKGRWIPMGKFYGNIAHNVGTGIFMYPPRYASFDNPDYKDMDRLENFFAWNVYLAYDSVSSNMKMIDFTVIGAHTGMNIDSGQNLLIHKSTFRKVCYGVIMADNDNWIKVHSGANVDKVVFDRMWEKSDYCAPIVFRTTARKAVYAKLSAQFKNLRLYRVKKLFSFDGNGLTNNINPYGFHVYNVRSYKSDMADIAPANGNGKQSYIIRHRHSGNFDENNSLVRNCAVSNIGGYPNSNELFVCKEQCWRPIALIFKQVLGNGVPVSMKFVSESGEIFFVNETNLAKDNYFCPSDYIHIIQIVPAVKYKIFLVDSDMKELSKKDHKKADIRFYHIDQRFDGFETNLKNYGCVDNVILDFNDSNLGASDFKNCGGYSAA